MDRRQIRKDQHQRLNCSASTRSTEHRVLAKQWPRIVLRGRLIHSPFWAVQKIGLTKLGCPKTRAVNIFTFFWAVHNSDISFGRHKAKRARDPPSLELPRRQLVHKHGSHIHGVRLPLLNATCPGSLAVCGGRAGVRRKSDRTWGLRGVCGLIKRSDENGMTIGWKNMIVVQ